MTGGHWSEVARDRAWRLLLSSIGVSVGAGAMIVTAVAMLAGETGGWVEPTMMASGAAVAGGLASMIWTLARIIWGDD